ncbi:MAG: FAD-dependent oxidoreductase [Lachnospiraceae bacterium]|nr:FAD-dependent oxidoreductase [Lachnospiraceae bacterium]
MQNRLYDAIIVGGGPAGLAAALSLRENGIDDILILERDKEPGGILNQCIHNGFGLHTFDEELTGPEYAARYIKMTEEAGIPFQLNTMVMNIEPVEEDGTVIKVVTAMSAEYGMQMLKTRAVLLAMGCREKPRGALNIPGYRPAGIYSAGTAQKFVNIDGFMPGREVVILGSGDIGLIMARRMTLEGAKVKLVAEIMPYSGGLKRNIVQCLDDYNIPLILSHTVVKIKGRNRVEAVVIAKVDENLKPIPGTEEEIKCDTLLLSVGLIPENELSRNMGLAMSPATRGAIVDDDLQTSCPGVFACGNVLHVHDLVDNVSKEAVQAGKHAAGYIKAFKEKGTTLVNSPDPDSPLMKKFAARNATRNGVNPNDVIKNEDGTVTYTLPCINCPAGCIVNVTLKDKEVISVTGNTCERGETYARNEVTAPVRIVTTSVRVTGGDKPIAAVKTREAIPKGLIDACMDIIKGLTVKAPVTIGDVILENIAGTGIDLIATADVPALND